MSSGESDRIRELIESYVNGTLDESELAQLEQLLLQDAPARAYFRRYLGLDAALQGHGESAGNPWSSVAAEKNVMPSPSVSSRSWSRFLKVAGIGGIALLSVIAIVSLLFNHQRAAQASAGTLEEVIGDVRILGADGQVRSIEKSAALGQGDTVRTRGSESSTVVAYPDGTRLLLVGNTSVTCGDLHSKAIVVHQGTMSATVAPQPANKPLLLTTPAAQLQVLGTRFRVEAVANRTDLSVSEGRVRVVRTSDGKTVDVADGKQTVVTEQNKLQVQDIPSLLATWDVDFERALPPGWSSGERVTEGLPAGSRGGVKAVLKESEGNDDTYVVSSQEAWLQGLFAIRSTSHLHVTFKLENPKWINILLVTRTADPHEPRFSGNYLFKDVPEVAADKWQTLSVPLSLFQRIHQGEVPVTEVIPYKLTFFSDAPDRGLVIDRIRVTPDGSGEVELKDVE